MIKENDKFYFDKNKEALYKLIVHAKTNVPFYREYYQFEIPKYDDFNYDFWNSIPYLEKKYVRDDSKHFIDERENFDELTIDTTSGTEGKPIICYRSKIERMQCSNALWGFRRKYVKDLRPTDRFARFYAFRNKNDEMISNKIIYKDSDILLPMFDLSENKLIEYWNAITEFKPRWIHGPSSTIYNLAIAVKENNLEGFKFELIELSGEYVSKEQMEFIGNVLGENITNQYGCREYWPMAYSGLDGDLEISKNVFMEVLTSNEDDSSEIIMTTLKNNSWPIIKYRIGDVGKVFYKNDQAFLTVRQGRKADFFTLEGNKLFNAIVFSGLARGVCEFYNDMAILQFQMIKKSEKELCMKIKMSNSSKRDEIYNKFICEIRKVIGNNVILGTDVVDYIEPNPITGKTKDFIDLSR